MSPPFHRGGVLGGRGVRSDSADGCGRPNSLARVPAGEASSGSRPAPAGVQVLRSEQLNTRGGTAALRRPLRRRGGRDLAVRVARVVVTTPSGDAGRRALGAFLRSRRERLSPDDVGICDSSRRRTPGLRREEVAALSGVSLSWYTWLEQGRDIKVSRQVLAALARSLRLSPPEVRHLYRLCDELPPELGDPHSCPGSDGQLDAMLRALEPNPAVLLDQHWDVLAWNRAEAALFTDYAALPVERRNMLWVIFGWPPARFLMTDWEAQASQVLAQFRVRADEEPGDPRFAAVVADLLAVVPDFARFWQRHEVADYQTVDKHFTHPRAGRLVLRQSKLIAADDPRVHLLARFPADESTKGALALLIE